MAEKSLSQFLDSLDEKVLECAICLNRINKPTTLTCLHTFCLPCLELWNEEKSDLVCPTCNQSYTIPEGGLSKLPPNTFINNLLESIEEIGKSKTVKCLCGNNDATFYCVDCRNYLCSSCKNNHQMFPQLKDHVMHSIEVIQSMSPIEFSSLNSPLCSLHKNKALEFYCKVCLTPICTNCAITDHNEHKPVDVSGAFNEFVEAATQLEQGINKFHATVKTRQDFVQRSIEKLNKNKTKCKNDIEEIILEVRKCVVKLEEELLLQLDEKYNEKMQTSNRQLDELNKIKADVNSRWNYISQLLKGNKATALQSSHQALTSLGEKITKLPDFKPDDGEIHLLQEKAAFKKLDEDGIGHVTDNFMKYFELSKVPKTFGVDKPFAIKIGEKYASQLNSNLTKVNKAREPTGESKPTTIKQINGDFIVEGMCTSTGWWQLDVKLGENHINGSPLILHAEKGGLLRVVNLKRKVKGCVMSGHGSLLVSDTTNEILDVTLPNLKTKTVKLPQVYSVHKMKKMKNGDIIFCDHRNRCIILCKPTGKILRSHGVGTIGSPYGLDVNESTNELFVADFSNHSVLVISLSDDQLIRKIGSQGKNTGKLDLIYDVAVTKEGDVIVADSGNHRVQVFRKNGINEVMIKSGEQDGRVLCPYSVLIDDEENLIVGSLNKVQLFTKSGKFIKRIGGDNDGVVSPHGLCVISKDPRKLAVTNKDNNNLLIFNY